MEKPQPPAPEQFGTSATEVAVTPDFRDNVKPTLWLIGGFIVFGELWEASKLSANDWAQHWIAYLFAGLFLPIVLAAMALMPSLIIGLILAFALDRISRATWPQYQRVRDFKIAETEYRANLAEYELWLRRQQEQFWKSLNGTAFERELGRLFKKIGYRVSSTPATADGGVDLILEDEGQRIVVQCKAHASKVGIATARELVASMIDFQARKGILAVTSGVTKPVAEYVQARNIEIYDLNRILSLQRQHG